MAEGIPTSVSCRILNLGHELLEVGLAVALLEMGRASLQLDRSLRRDLGRGDEERQVLAALRLLVRPVLEGDLLDQGGEVARRSAVDGNHAQLEVCPPVLCQHLRDAHLRVRARLLSDDADHVYRKDRL
jgi:hypothetical protein